MEENNAEKNKRFWEIKELQDMTDDEWESLCDGCGRCCFRKIVDGYLWNKKILFTKIACNLLDTNTCRCTQYENRFELQKECIKLDRKKVKDFKWLPKTCAYRLIYEHKQLYPWHPLISGTPDSVRQAGICIKDGIHESEVYDWYDYVIQDTQ